MAKEPTIDSSKPEGGIVNPPDVVDQLRGVFDVLNRRCWPSQRDIVDSLLAIIERLESAAAEPAGVDDEVRSLKKDIVRFNDTCVKMRRELEAENAKLRDNQRLRFWNCPCGDLVIRDTHYNLECGNCKEVQVDENEFMPDFEIHRLRTENAKLRQALEGLYNWCDEHKIGKSYGSVEYDAIETKAFFALEPPEACSPKPEAEMT